MTAADDATELLAKVTSALAAGEARPGQVDMARAVADAIDRGRHLFVQAGTGTGKSLGYLAPALASGRRTVVATATKTLQDQLAGKDLPFLEAAGGVPFTWALLKGRSNYLCVQRISELAQGGADQLVLDGVAERAPAAELRRLVAWRHETESGDRSELDFEPSPAAWGAVSVSAGECPGRTKCPSGAACFAEAARDRAAAADVVVVNLHLYGVHLASGRAVLPDHDVLVVDEAHQLEEVISATAGLELGPGRVRHLARLTASILDDPGRGARLDTAADQLAAALEEWRDRRVPRQPEATLASALDRVRAECLEVLAALRAVPDDAPLDAKTRAQRAALAATGLADTIDTVRSIPATHVGWVEGPAQLPMLRLAPIDVGEVLTAGLWDTVTVIATSATLQTGLPATLAAPEDRTDTLDVGSPFDYEENAVLYCAAHLPDPRSAAFDEAAISELGALATAAGGRTLALFTSRRALQLAAERLEDALPGTVLVQDRLPRPALLRAFAEDPTSSLFATMGFWQGVDVPGDACVLVVVDRLPFPRPDEPLLQARRERARAGAFRTIDLPRAATLLAQGAGRLIRTATDRGMVAVLDPRLATASYRWDLVRALPPMRRTRDREEALAFLESLTPRDRR